MVVTPDPFVDAVPYLTQKAHEGEDVGPVGRSCGSLLRHLLFVASCRFE